MSVVASFCCSFEHTDATSLFTTLKHPFGKAIPSTYATTERPTDIAAQCPSHIDSFETTYSPIFSSHFSAFATTFRLAYESAIETASRTPKCSTQWKTDHTAFKTAKQTA